MPNIIQFSYARGALIGAINSILVHFKINKEATVWIPAFICDTVVYLLEAYKIKIKYYPITKNLEPDWAKIKSLKFMQGDILLFVHYFGFQIPIKEALEFCYTHKLYMIEDCAHSIVPKIEKGGIGTHGHASIFGLRKALPIPHGGFLFLNNIKYSDPKNVSKLCGIYRSPIKMMIQWMFCKLKIKYPLNPQPNTNGLVSKHPENYSFFNFQEEMDSISRKITNTVDINEIIIKRTNNYLYYKKSLEEITNIFIPISFKIIKNQTTPWVFFFFYEHAHELIKYLVKNGIPATSFPELHPSILSNPDYDYENNLYKRSVTLPVHQDVNMSDIDIIVNMIKEFDINL